MKATIQAAVMDEDFRLYDYLCVLAGMRGLRDEDCVIYRYARAQGSNYQGESLVQWCDGWQDQYHGEPDELVAWIEGFQRWLTKNLEPLAAMERLSADLLGEDDASSVPNKVGDEVPLEQLSSVPEGATLRTVHEVLAFLDEFDGWGMVATDEYLQVEGIRKLYGHLLEDDYEDEGATPQPDKAETVTSHIEPDEKLTMRVTRTVEDVVRRAFPKLVGLVRPHLDTIRLYGDWYHENEDFADNLVDRAKEILIEEMGVGLSPSERERRCDEFNNVAMDIGLEVVYKAIDHLNNPRSNDGTQEDEKMDSTIQHVDPTGTAAQVVVQPPRPLDEMLTHLDREHSAGVYHLPVVACNPAHAYGAVHVTNPRLNDLLRDIMRSDWQRYDAGRRGQSTPDADELIERLYAQLESGEFTEEERASAYSVLD